MEKPVRMQYSEDPTPNDKILRFTVAMRHAYSRKGSVSESGLIIFLLAVTAY